LALDERIGACMAASNAVTSVSARRYRQSGIAIFSHKPGHAIDFEGTADNLG
jgi:hypothetical protein